MKRTTPKTQSTDFGWETFWDVYTRIHDQLPKNGSLYFVMNETPPNEPIGHFEYHFAPRQAQHAHITVRVEMDFPNSSLIAQPAQSLAKAFCDLFYNELLKKGVVL